MLVGRHTRRKQIANGYMEQRKVRLSIFSVGVALALFLAIGFGIPRLFIGNGVGRFSGTERWVAERALVEAQLGCLDQPIARSVVLKMRVVRVVLAAPGMVMDGPQAVGTDLVLVRAYTLFGIPISTISVRDGSTKCQTPQHEVRRFD